MNRAEMEKKAFDYCDSGFSCAEAIAKTIAEQYVNNPNPDIVKAATGFGGGIGGTHAHICGALTGGILAIGYLHGRTEPGKDIQLTKDLVSEFVDSFVREFGSENCAALLESMGEQVDSSKCKKLTAEATGMLSEILGGTPE